MPDRCSICEITRPAGGTNLLVLNEGRLWLEFCGPCGDRTALTNQDGEHWLVRELFASCQARDAGAQFVRDPADVARAAELAGERDEQMAREEQERDEYELECFEHDKRMHELWLEELEERRQLAVDHWVNVEYAAEPTRVDPRPRMRAPNFLLCC